MDKKGHFMNKEKSFFRNNIVKAVVSIFLCISLVLGMTGCGLSSDKEKKDEVTSDVTSEKKDDEKKLTKEDYMIKANDYLKNMTLEEKIGQLFVVNLEQLDYGKGSFFEWRKCTEKMKKSIKKYHPGGVILFSRNIADRKQTIKLLSDMQSSSTIPLFTTVDEEGGDVARIASNPKMNTTSFPSMEQIGKEKDSEYVGQMGETIANDIKGLGFNVDFAPVADVKTSKLNQEIGTRSFGDDPDKVADMVEAFVRGMQGQNISATLKHFPGQGSSKGDTHVESVNIDSSITGLRDVDFVPFKAGIDADADFTMVSHISVSKVTETSQPASMSKLIMQTILRDELGFQGIIITDAMDMASITDNYTAAEAAYGAISGGADIVLMPTDFESAYNEILSKVKEGKISEKRIDESVLRILTVKFYRGLME